MRPCRTQGYKRTRREGQGAGREAFSAAPRAPVLRRAQADRPRRPAQWRSRGTPAARRDPRCRGRPPQRRAHRNLIVRPRQRFAPRGLFQRIRVPLGLAPRAAIERRFDRIPIEHMWQWARLPSPRSAAPLASASRRSSSRTAISAFAPCTAAPRKPCPVSPDRSHASRKCSRAERARQLRVTGKVGEQDGHLPPFGGRRWCRPTQVRHRPAVPRTAGKSAHRPGPPHDSASTRGNRRASRRLSFRARGVTTASAGPLRHAPTGPMSGAARLDIRNAPALTIAPGNKRNLARRVSMAMK